MKESEFKVLQLHRNIKRAQQLTPFAALLGSMGLGASRNLRDSPLTNTNRLVSNWPSKPSSFERNLNLISLCLPVFSLDKAQNINDEQNYCRSWHVSAYLVNLIHRCQSPSVPTADQRLNKSFVTASSWSTTIIQCKGVTEFRGYI